MTCKSCWWNILNFDILIMLAVNIVKQFKTMKLTINLFDKSTLFLVSNSKLE